VGRLGCDGGERSRRPCPGAEEKLAHLDERTVRTALHLGIPSYRDIVGRTVTATKKP
jgi:hypothetical protein